MPLHREPGQKVFSYKPVGENYLLIAGDTKLLTDDQVSGKTR